MGSLYFFICFLYHSVVVSFVFFCGNLCVQNMCEVISISIISYPQKNLPISVFYTISVLLFSSVYSILLATLLLFCIFPTCRCPLCVFNLCHTRRQFYPLRLPTFVVKFVACAT